MVSVTLEEFTEIVDRKFDKAEANGDVTVIMDRDGCIIKSISFGLNESYVIKTEES